MPASIFIWVIMTPIERQIEKQREGEGQIQMVGNGAAVIVFFSVDLLFRWD